MLHLNHGKLWLWGSFFQLKTVDLFQRRSQPARRGARVLRRRQGARGGVGRGAGAALGAASSCGAGAARPFSPPKMAVPKRLLQALLGSGSSGPLRRCRHRRAGGAARLLCSSSFSGAVIEADLPGDDDNMVKGERAGPPWHAAATRGRAASAARGGVKVTRGPGEGGRGAATLFPTDTIGPPG